MTDSEQFRSTVSKRGLKYKYLANTLQITPYGLQKKIDNRSEFKASEIVKLSYVLNLTEAERNQIFFASNSDL